RSEGPGPLRPCPGQRSLGTLPPIPDRGRRPRSNLDRRAPRPTGAAMKLSANGIDINYEMEGDGPVVAMSHSLACHLGMWDEQAAALRGRYRVLRFDTRGH